MVHYYAGKVPSKVVFNGVTDEVAHSGKHSYKMVVKFEPGRWGNAYFKLPFNIPQWTDLHAKFYFRWEVDSKLSEAPWFFNGFVGAQASQGITGNNIDGEKKGEDNGWELWEATASKTGDVGDYIMGIGVRMQLPDHSPATTLTMYIDDVEVHGKLPSNYEQKWTAVYRYFTVDREKIMRTQGAHRYRDMAAWLNRFTRQYQKRELPRVSAALRQRYNAVTQRIEADRAAVAPMVETIKAGLDNTDQPLRVDLDKPERLLSHLGMWIDAARGYTAYAARHGGEPVVTYVIEPTRSYPILPTGPEAHNWETTHYSWSGRGFEHPQILPEAEAVPVAPSRMMKAAGCRGTFVPLSFAITSEKELQDVSIDASDLRLGSHTIAAEHVEVRVVAPWYRPMARDGKQNPELKNEMLLHDPAFVVPADGKIENIYKDAKFGSDSEKLKPVTIPAGQVRQFFMTVRVPDDAASGVYRGKVEARAGDIVVGMDVQLKVQPFDLEPTPLAYSFFYRSYLRSAEEKKKQGIHPWYKTEAQMQAELTNMGEHGCNTNNMYGGTPKKTDDGWDFTAMEHLLAMGRRAGLTRSPFMWLGHGQDFIPDPRPGRPKSMETVITNFNSLIPAVNGLCDANGYPRPALFGHDEASGERLMKLREGYGAVNDAGGLVTVACYPNFFDEIGDALSLPIIYGGGQTGTGMRNMKRSQQLGYETWIYNCPTSSMPASASVYRRRYGLMMWRNGEHGVANWEYQGLGRREADPQYNNDFQNPIYAMAYPVWEGKPIDTIHFEAFREGVYDARYMATLEKHLAAARKSGKKTAMCARIDTWLASFSVNDNVNELRERMADFIVVLTAPE